MWQKAGVNRRASVWIYGIFFGGWNNDGAACCHQNAVFLVFRTSSGDPPLSLTFSQRIPNDVPVKFFRLFGCFFSDNFRSVGAVNLILCAKKIVIKAGHCAGQRVVAISLSDGGACYVIHDAVGKLTGVCAEVVEFLDLGLQIVNPSHALRASDVQSNLEGITFGVGSHCSKKLNKLISIDEAKGAAKKVYATATSLPGWRLQVDETCCHHGVPNIDGAPGNHSSALCFKYSGVCDVGHFSKHGIHLFL